MPEYDVVLTSYPGIVGARCSRATEGRFLYFFSYDDIYYVGSHIYIVVEEDWSFSTRGVI